MPHPLTPRQQTLLADHLDAQARAALVLPDVRRLAEAYRDAIVAHPPGSGLDQEPLYAAARELAACQVSVDMLRDAERSGAAHLTRAAVFASWRRVMGCPS